MLRYKLKYITFILDLDTQGILILHLLSQP